MGSYSSNTRAARVRKTVDHAWRRSRTTRYVCDVSQTCCPWNVRFAEELNEPAFTPREVFAGRDARTLARDILQMTQEEFSAAFKGPR